MRSDRLTAASALVVAASVLNYYDRLLMTVVAQPVKREFGLSDTELGTLTGPAFVVVYSLSTLAFGRLADRANRRLIVAGILALWSGMTALGGLAGNFVQLAITRAGVGIGEGGTNPAILSLIAELFPPGKRGRAIAVFQSGGMAGILLSFLLGGWIAAAYGWRAAFMVAGLPGIVLAVVALAVIPESRRDRSAESPGATLADSLVLLRRNRAYRWIVLGSCLAVIGNLGMLQWLPIFFMRSHGLGLREIGLFFGPAAALGMAAGMMLGGALGDRLTRISAAHSMTLCIVATLALVPVYWLVLWVPSVSVAMILTFIATAMSVSYSPTMTAAMLAVVVPEVRGMASAAFNFMNGIVGQAILPLFVGILSDALARRLGEESLRWSLTIVIACLWIAAAVFMRTRQVIAAEVAGRSSSA